MSLLRLDHVNMGYDPARLVLRDVSLSLTAGESALVLGDNGSGKSTLGRLIGGLAPQTSGSITIGNQSLDTISTRARPAHTIYVSQVSYLQFFCATLEEEIALAARQSGFPVPTQETVARFTLPPQDTNPRDLNYPQMWRLQLLLLGSVFNPSVLFIDEIVAPGAAGQREALDFTLAHRHGQGRVTLLAYQREIESRFDRMFAVEDGRVTERRGQQNRPPAIDL
jgi:energy-coupling factor transporter ATP-binding protein EcfA2